MKRVKTEFDRQRDWLDEQLGAGRSFDIVGRTLSVGGRRAKLWVVNGYAQDALLERILSSWMQLPDWEGLDLQSFLERYVTACDAAVEQDLHEAVRAVFSGKTLLIVEGFAGGVVLEAKQFPLRAVEEPDSSRVLRGSHDGFGESLMKNAALLRRRIRTPQLTLEGLCLTQRSKADVALCYLEGKADPELVRQLRDKLNAVDVRSLSMGQESVAEAIAPRQWYNPFPKVRYTERPDVATACLMEGGRTGND